MGVEWVSMLSSIVFSRVKHSFSAKIKKDYGMTDDNNFSTDLSRYTKAHFPFVLFQILPSLEQGRDTEGTTINAGLFTFQIDVTDNKSQARAKNVAFEILRIMKGMGFEVTAMPSFEDTKDVHRCTARYRRSICENDILGSL